MKLKHNLYNFVSGEIEGEIELPEAIFSVLPFSSACIKRVTDWQLSKARAGTRKTKNLSEVSGTGKKPHAQKGSGRARQGSLRSVHMRGGATVHGPVVRSHETSLPKKVKKLALKSALSRALHLGNMTFVRDFAMDSISSKECLSRIRKLSKATKVVLCTDCVSDTNLALSCRNLKYVKLLSRNAINVYDLVNAEQVIMSQSAVNKLNI